MRRQITSISDSFTINYKTRCNGPHWNFGGVFFLEWPNVQIPKISDEYNKLGSIKGRGSGWLNKLNLTTHTSLSLIRCGFAPSFVNYKKGAVDSQPQVIKFTSCLSRVGGSLRVLLLLPPLKLVAMI